MPVTIKRFATGFTVLTFLSSALPSLAQETKTWTLQECIDYALEHNLELKQKQIANRQSQVEVYAAKGTLFPSLSFATNQNVSWRPWSNSYVNITDGSMSSTNSTVNYNGTYGLQAQWTAWDGGASRKKFNRAKIAAQQSLVDEEITNLSIQEQIIRSYVQILYQTSAVKVNERILSSTQALLERARIMYETGSIPRADLAQMEAQVCQDEYNVTNASTQLSGFKLDLKTILEIIGPGDINIEIPSGESTITTILPEINDVYANALATRPEIIYSDYDLELADLDIDIAKRGYYPTVSLAAGINTNSVSGLDQSWYDQIKTNLSNSIGLTISVPIFDNRKNSANVRRAKLDKELAAINLELKRQQLYSEIENLWLDAKNARKQYEAAVKNVYSMNESYTLVSEQFSVGLKDIADLTTAKNNLIQAEQQMLQAKYTAMLNSTLLNFYNGSPLDLK